ncbi:TolB family protein [Scytonema sp. NUACC26]|uniref:TolB family protein n=1 Tax=Scytonema sp. NUACC26 TaxID=3140176 RepID=UPI0034DBE74F
MSFLSIEIKIIGLLSFLLLSFTGCHNKKTYQNQNIQLSKRMCPGLIAFVSQGNRSTGDRAIYTMNKDGSNQKNLTSNTVFSNHPVWSPNGKYIAFQSLANITYFKNQIYVMNTDGSHLKNLSKSETSDSLPLWSPNGQYIAFTRSFASDNQSNDITQNNIRCSKLRVKDNIYVMNSDGSNQKNLAKMRDEQMLSVPIGWSQDSKRVFFHAFKLCDTQTVAYLSAVDVDTLNETVITELPQYGRYTAKISLSPNGQKIAFHDFLIYI